MNPSGPELPPPVPGAPAAIEWRLSHFVLAFVGGVLAANMMFAFLAVDMQAGLVDVDAVSANQLFGLVIPAQHFGSLLVVGVIIAVRRSTPASSLGFELEFRQGWWTLAGAGLAIIVGLLTVPLASLVGVENNPQQAVEEFSEVSSGVPLLAAVLTLVVLTPITEEIMYRGILQRAVGRRLSTVPMLAVTTTIWGLAHLLDPADADSPWWAQALVTFVPISIFGLVAAIVTLRQRGRLGRAVFLHAGWNLLGVIALIGAQVQ